MNKNANLLLDLRVKTHSIAQLKPYSRNARSHSDKQIHQIAKSITTFGFVNPVLIDAKGNIVAGHGRVSAAKLLRMTKVPTIRLDHLTDSERRAYILADNKLAQLAGWDEEILAIELQHLFELDLDFDLTVTGFETPEIDLLIQSLAPESDADDIVPSVGENTPAVSRFGDLWVMGPHRLLCGDARKRADYRCLMRRRRARMVFTDPPYNVPIDGHVCGLGSVHHNAFAMASG